MKDRDIARDHDDRQRKKPHRRGDTREARNADRKPAEEQLRDCQEQLALACEAALLGSFEWNPQTKQFTWSPEVEALYGLPQGALEGSMEAWLQRVHVDDRAGTSNAHGDALETGQFQHTFRVVWPDGSVHWLESRGRIFFDEQGRATRMLGVSGDITDRVLTERTLREREEVMRYIVKHDPNAIAVFDRHLRYIAVSNRYLHDYNVTEEDILGKHHYDVFPEIPQKWRDVHRRCLAGAIERNDDDYFVRPDGSITYTRWECRPWYQADGTIGGMITYTEVTTERKLTEQSLRKSEALLRETQHLAKIGGWQYEVAPPRMFWTREVFNIHEVEEDFDPNDIDRNIDFYAPQDRAIIREAFRGAVERGEPYDMELQFVSAAGTRKWVRTTAQPERVAGKVVRVIGNIVDITERKRTEAELKAFNETLEQRVAQRTAQLRALASELAQTEQRERRHMAQVLHDHLQQLLVAARFKLVTLSRRIPDKALGPVATQASELLEQCIAESRSLTMELSPPVLYDAGLVAGLHWLARWMHQKHDLIVTVQADDEAELADEGIRVFLFQAVRELLFNVAKHAQANEAQVRMTKTPDEAIQIEVRDFGAGFDPARLQPQAVSPEGFGLFSIRERAEFLGGLLHLDSTPGQGTRAIISVPIRQAPPVAASRQAADGQRPTDMAIPSASHDIPGPTGGSTSRIRVLLVDDHPILRRGLADLFDERPEIDLVAEASDGQEAVETALRLRPDVVLMDVTMPRMDGVEATRRITAALPAVSVIGLSMHEGEDMARAMRDAGARAYLSKSEAAETLVSTILRVRTLTPA
jgi:PAS domain S-box-containing protein